MAAAKVVVVTGASAGIGRATACEFARHGWRVTLLARGQDGLEGARADVERLGGEALVLPTDVADEAKVGERAAVGEHASRAVGGGSGGGGCAGVGAAAALTLGGRPL